MDTPSLPSEVLTVGEVLKEKLRDTPKAFMLTEGEALSLYAAAMSAEAVNKRWGHKPDPDMTSARLVLLRGLEFPEELDTLLGAMGLRVTGVKPDRRDANAAYSRTPSTATPDTE